MGCCVPGGACEQRPRRRNKVCSDQKRLWLCFCCFVLCLSSTPGFGEWWHREWAAEGNARRGCRARALRLACWWAARAGAIAACGSGARSLGFTVGSVSVILL